MYTIHDLVFSNTSKTTRRWNPITGCFHYSEAVTLDVETMDGLYKSETDSDGYSYWRNWKNNYTLGNRGTDYFFLTEMFPNDALQQQRAIDLLNSLM